MRYSSRIFLYGPFVLLLLLAVGVCAVWYVESKGLEARLAGLNGREMASGVTLSFSPPEMAGFPFRTDAVFKNFRATIKGVHGPVTWHSEDFALHRLSYGTQTLFEAAGKQTITWVNAKGETRELVFIPGRMQASSIEDKIGLSRFDLDILGIQSADAKAARFQFHIRRDPRAPLLNIVMKSDRLSLSPQLQALLNTPLKNGGFKADVTRGDSFDALRAGEISWIEAQTRWHANKGEIRPVE